MPRPRVLRYFLLEFIQVEVANLLVEIRALGLFRLLEEVGPRDVDHGVWVGEGPLEGRIVWSLKLIRVVMWIVTFLLQVHLSL